MAVSSARLVPLASGYRASPSRARTAGNGKSDSAGEAVNQSPRGPVLVNICPLGLAIRCRIPCMAVWPQCGRSRRGDVGSSIWSRYCLAAPGLSRAARVDHLTGLGTTSLHRLSSTSSASLLGPGRSAQDAEGSPRRGDRDASVLRGFLSSCRRGSASSIAHELSARFLLTSSTRRPRRFFFIRFLHQVAAMIAA